MAVREGPPHAADEADRSPLSGILPYRGVRSS